MPVKPDVPCAVCGELMWRGRGSLPSGQATCLRCRRQRNPRRTPTHPLVVRICPMCQRQFTTRLAVFCSPDCRRRVRNARRKPPRPPGVPNPRSQSKVARLRRIVGDRDGWICYRCGLPIDPNLSGNLPDGPTLDHIVLLADGVDPYDPTTATVSHRLCNTEHGAREGGRRYRERQMRQRWTNPAW